MSVAHVEVVVGRKVRDSEGKIAGRLEEVHADWRGGECIVTHYVLAAKRRGHSMNATHLAAFILRQLGATKFHGTVIVPWDKMDWSDPLHPRVTCRAEELRRVG